MTWRRWSSWSLVAATMVACTGGDGATPVPTAVTATTVAPSTVASTVAPTTTEATEPAAVVPMTPFASTSIWRRLIPEDATYVDVSDMLSGPTSALDSIGVDLVTLCTTDSAAPLVAVERSAGWQLPGRATSTGEVLYERRLAPDACTDVTFNPIGNGLWVLYDPSTTTADLGIGGWREPGGPLLNTAPDGPSAHGLEVVDGDGLRGYGRASGLPALGGLLRAGELTDGIPHAVAVNLPAGLLSADRHFVWPASSADGTADATYRGSNPALAMGTLLAVPSDVDLDALTWRTVQGRNLAIAAQRHGWYVVDVLLAANQVQFGIDVKAARSDLGMTMRDFGLPTVDPAFVDGEGLTSDVLQIVGLLAAVPQSG